MSKFSFREPDWSINDDQTAVQHRSGLSIQIASKKKLSFFPTAVDIQGLARLAGTEWSGKTPVLVAQGLSLLAVDLR